MTDADRVRLDDDSGIAAELIRDILTALDSADRARLDRLRETLRAFRGQDASLTALRAEFLLEIERVFALLGGRVGWGHEARASEARAAAVRLRRRVRDGKEVAASELPGRWRFTLPRGLVSKWACIDPAFRALDAGEVAEVLALASTAHGSAGGAGNVGPLDVAAELAVRASALELGPREGEEFDAAKERAKAALKDAKKHREKNWG